MATYISTQFSTAEEFENWIRMSEHANKDFLDGLCEDDKKAWDNKGCNIRVKDGKLQLLCANGNVLAEADYYAPDNKTVCCDENGEVKVKGIANANEPDGRNFRMWVGTLEEYRAIRIKDDKTLYLVSDDTTIDEIIYAVNTLNDSFEAFKTALSNGDFVVFEARKATKDGNGNNITDTYVKKSGDEMTGHLQVPYLKVRDVNKHPAVGLFYGDVETAIGGLIGHRVTEEARCVAISTYNKDQDGKETRYAEYFQFPVPDKNRTSSNYYNVLTNKKPVTVAQGGTGAADKLNACKNIGAAMVGLGERIPANADLNSYTTVGTYYSVSGDNSATLLNTPYTETGFKLEVFNTVSASHFIQEIKANSGAARTFRRTGSTSDGWNTWYQVLQTSDNVVPVSLGGTGATNAAAARENLGVPSTDDLKSGALTVKKAETATNATEATNASKVNNLKITRDSNGVLKIGDTIIPQKNLMWSAGLTIEGTNTADSISLGMNTKVDDTYELHTSDGVVVKFRKSFRAFYGDSGDIMHGFVKKNDYGFTYLYLYRNATTNPVTFTKLYKIIE